MGLWLNINITVVAWSYGFFPPTKHFCSKGSSSSLQRLTVNYWGGNPTFLYTNTYIHTHTYIHIWLYTSILYVQLLHTLEMVPPPWHPSKRLAPCQFQAVVALHTCVLKVRSTRGWLKGENEIKPIWCIGTYVNMMLYKDVIYLYIYLSIYIYVNIFKYTVNANIDAPIRSNVLLLRSNPFVFWDSGDFGTTWYCSLKWRLNGGHIKHCFSYLNQIFFAVKISLDEETWWKTARNNKTTDQTTLQQQNDDNGAILIWCLWGSTRSVIDIDLFSYWPHGGLCFQPFSGVASP